MFAWLRSVARWFRGGYTLEIYMKSGSVIVLDGIRDYKFVADSLAVTSFSIERTNCKRNLLVPTIILSQIEAICRVD